MTAHQRPEQGHGPNLGFGKMRQDVHRAQPVQRGKRLWGCLVMGLAIAPTLMLVPVSRSQQALPPPPSVPGGGLPSLAPVPPPQGAQPLAVPPLTSPYPQESIYQAPLQAAPPGVQSSFVVLVNGDSPYLLQQVQRIEPTAFVREYQGRRFIQAGDFPSEANAQQRLVVLSQQGIGAQVIYLGGGVSNPSLVGINPQAVVQDLAKIPHFQVVVPTSPNNFGTITTKMVAMGVRPEAIQAKRAPLGPHVSVGPFIQQGEAESVSRYLRAGGMDARVYYAR